MQSFVCFLYTYVKYLNHDEIHDILLLSTYIIDYADASYLDLN